MSCYSMQQAIIVIVCSFSLFGNTVLDQQSDVKDAIYQPYVLSTDNPRKEERKPLPTNNQAPKNTVAKYVDETLATPVMPKEALTLLATPIPSNEASTPLATPVRFEEALILATPVRAAPVLSNEASKPLATPVRPNEALTPMETPVRSNDLSSKKSSDNIIPLPYKDGPGGNGISMGVTFPQNNPPRTYPDNIGRSTTLTPRVTNIDLVHVQIQNQSNTLPGAAKPTYSYVPNQNQQGTLPVLPVKELNQANDMFIITIKLTRQGPDGVQVVRESPTPKLNQENVLAPDKQSTRPPGKNYFMLATTGPDGQPNGQSKCDTPKIENGKAECGNTKGNAVLLCGFICNKSYKLKDVSKSTASCRNGIWFPKILPSCVSSYRPVGNLSRSILNGVSTPLVIPGRPAEVPIILATPVRTNEAPTSLGTPVRSNEMSSTNPNDTVIRVPDKAGAAENEKGNLLIYFPNNEPQDTLPKPYPNNIYRSTPSPRVTINNPVDTRAQNSRLKQDPISVNNQSNSGPNRQPSGDLTRNPPPMLPSHNHYPPPRRDRYEDRNQRVPIERPSKMRYPEDERLHRPRYINNERKYYPRASEESGERLCDHHGRRMKVHFNRNGTRRHDNQNSLPYVDRQERLHGRIIRPCKDDRGRHGHRFVKVYHLIRSKKYM